MSIQSFIWSNKDTLLFGTKFTRWSKYINWKSIYHISKDVLNTSVKNLYTILVKMYYLILARENLIPEITWNIKRDFDDLYISYVTHVCTRIRIYVYIRTSLMSLKVPYKFRENRTNVFRIKFSPERVALISLFYYFVL